MRQYSLEVNINFPALDSLVVYLREAQAQQKRIDDLTAQVAAVTSQLGKASDDLSGSMAGQQ